MTSMSDYTKALPSDNGLNVNASPWAGPVAFQASPFQASTPPPAPRHPITQATPQPIYAAQPLSMPPETVDQRPPCKFFLQGGCGRGTSCSFAHELPRDSTLSSNADGTTAVTGIIFNMNAKNTFTALARQSSVENMQTGNLNGMDNGHHQDQMGDQDGMFYDAAAYAAQQGYQMWDGSEGYSDGMGGMYGGYEGGGGGNAYYGADVMYGGQGPAQVTPPPQYQQQQMAYHTQPGSYAQPNGAFQHVFAQQQQQSQQQQNGGGQPYWDASGFAQGHSTPPQEPLRHVFQDPVHHPPAPQPQQATMAPTRTIQLPPSQAWGERHPSLAVLAHVDAVTPAILGTPKQQMVVGPSVRLQGADIVSSLHKLLQDKSPPKPVGHSPEDPILPPVTIAPVPPTTATAPPHGKGGNTNKGHTNGSSNGRGRGYGGHAYHTAGS